MLPAILVLYAIIISFGDTAGGGVARTMVLGLLALMAAHLRARPGLTRWVLALSAALVAVVAWALVSAPARVASGFVGASSLLLVLATVAIIGSTLRTRWRIDVATVLGVLCVYLLLALLFASVHQLLAAFSDAYLTGVSGRPTASDLLYFSVITMTTVGFGDIAPASGAARAVAVTEALVGQLYLVSVVAAVVGGWHRGGPP
jgi:hypothetical protein